MRAVVAVALLLACRGDHGQPHAGSGSAAGSVVPALLRSTNGSDELRMMTERVERTADRPAIQAGALLDRATWLGRLDDYRDAVARSATAIAASPDDAEAWRTRVRALTAVHEFTAARAALVTLHRLDATAATELTGVLDEATGPREHVLADHAAAASAYPTAINLTRYAASLALAGRVDEAIALVPRAAAGIRDNSALLFAWLLFQWGRLYEQNGDLAAARQFYAQACTRLPGYLEATVHLAQTSIATGDTASAKRVVAAALAADRQPALLELGAQLGLAQVADARTEWERYVTALPLAFADHAARFYLGVGADPKRALALAAQNLANRDVPEARTLVVEAALAAGDNAAACSAADPLATAPLRAHRFMAWRALVACGRTADADRLAKELGISP